MWIDLALVALVAAAALWWIAAVSAKETARAHAARICSDAGVQLLDQTVALRAVRPVRTHGGIALRWRYGFEFSIDGVGRERGQLTLLGGQLEATSVPRVSSPE
jgi:hypothetical protein